MNGYQSDVNLQNINYVGNFPLENSIGGYGGTSGVAGSYLLTLYPPISAYKTGMCLQVQFHVANPGASTLSVDGLGNVPLRKVDSAGIMDLEASDIRTGQIHILVYDGTAFQVATLGAGVAPVPAASQSEAGIVQLASQTEVDQGSGSTKAVTPSAVYALLTSQLHGRWANRGGYDCSTNPNYPSGVSGSVYRVTAGGRIGGPLGVPVQEGDLFYCHTNNAGGDQATAGNAWRVIYTNFSTATEGVAGIARIATQAEVDAGVLDDVIVSPQKLTGRMETKEDYLGNPITDGQVLQSSATGARSWKEVNRRLSTSYLSWTIGAGTLEETIGTTYTLPAGTLTGTRSLEINISGVVLLTGGDKTLKVRMGNEVLFSHTLGTTLEGGYAIRIFGGRFDSNIFKGVATLLLNGQPAVVQPVASTALDMDVADQSIAFTGQNAATFAGSIVRQAFMVQLIA